MIIGNNILIHIVGNGRWRWWYGIIMISRSSSREEIVGIGVEALGEELLLDGGIPEVLDLVVGSAGEMLGYLRPSVPQDSVDVDDGPFLLRTERAPLEIGSQVVYPPQPAALSASLQPCHFRHAAPTGLPMTMTAHALYQLLVFLGRPQSSLHLHFRATPVALPLPHQPLRLPLSLATTCSSSSLLHQSCPF